MGGGGLLNCWKNTRAKYEHISSAPFSPASRRPACEGRGGPVRKLTCVSRQTCLSKSGKRHSNPPPRKWAPLSKLASLCFPSYTLAGSGLVHAFVPYRTFQAVMGCTSQLHSFGLLLLCASASNAVCILTTLPRKRPLRSRRCTLMNSHPCPHPPQLDLSRKRDQLCDVL